MDLHHRQAKKFLRKRRLSSKKLSVSEQTHLQCSTNTNVEWTLSSRCFTLISKISSRLPVNDKRLLEMAFYTYMETIPLLRYKDRPAPYNFSPGWLAKFKKRFNIRMHVGHGEEGDVDMVKNAPLFKAIADGLTGISPRDIYNCDETGLYLKALSNRTLSDTSVKGKKLIRGARVSILACCNANGTDKRPLFVLSAHRPQGLVEDTQAVIMTDFTGSGYMTQELFQEWLDVFDVDMKEQGRKIVLLMDNAPGHGKLEQYHLTNITIVFLPPKTTSVAQPLDAGIIRSYKTKYTRHMIRVTANYRGSNGLQSTVVPNAKYWPCLVKAWDDITKATIRNCFAHVPTIPPELRSELRTTQEDDIDKEMEQLKQELMKLYPAGDAAIQMQKDYGVLTYLKSCEGDGPTQGLMDAIKQVSRMEEYKDQFYSPEELTVVEEDQLDDESDPHDLDYFPSCAPPVLVAEQTRILDCRSGPIVVELPLNVASSQETTVSQWSHSSQEPQDYIDDDDMDAVCDDPNDSELALHSNSSDESTISSQPVVESREPIWDELQVSYENLRESFLAFSSRCCSSTAREGPHIPGLTKHFDLIADMLDLTCADGE